MDWFETPTRPPFYASHTNALKLFFTVNNRIMDWFGRVSKTFLQFLFIFFLILFILLTSPTSPKERISIEKP